MVTSRFESRRTASSEDLTLRSTGMLATIASATLMGVAGTAVTVEVHVSNGLPGFTIVGLPDASCREARDRVRAALLSSGLKWPTQRVTVNLAPTGVRKSGAGLDLAMAMACWWPTVRSGPRPWSGRPTSASSGSTAASGPYPARSPWSTRSTSRRWWWPPARRWRRSWWAATSCGPPPP